MAGLAHLGLVAHSNPRTPPRLPLAAAGGSSTHAREAKPMDGGGDSRQTRSKLSNSIAYAMAGECHTVSGAIDGKLLRHGRRRDGRNLGARFFGGFHLETEVSKRRPNPARW